MQVNVLQKVSILQYFQPSLSNHLSLRSLFCLFLSVRFTQVLLHYKFKNFTTPLYQIWMNKSAANACGVQIFLLYIYNYIECIRDEHVQNCTFGSFNKTCGDHILDWSAMRWLYVHVYKKYHRLGHCVLAHLSSTCPW